MSIKYKSIKNKYARRTLVVIATAMLCFSMLLFMTLITAASIVTFTFDQSVKDSWAGVFKDDLPQWVKGNW